jgi:hypothetical protein
MPLTLRLVKGSELSYSELDDNFTYLSSSLNSLIATGSVSSNVLTFTKGDGSTFNLTVNTGSAAAANTGSLMVTGSVSSNILTFTKGDGSTFSLTVNTGSGGGGGGGTTLVQDLTSNQTVGGVAPGELFTAGSTLESVLRAMLITYIEPTISSLTIRNGGSNISTATRDVGNSFTCNSASFLATVDSPDGNYPVSASITGSGADSGLFQAYFSNTLSGTNTFTLGSALTINRASTAGNVTFIVNTKSQTTADTQSTNTGFAFYWRNYLAASSTVISDNSTAQSVINSGVVTSTLTTGKSWTATCDANNADGSKFTYIIYPATYGDLSNVIQNGALSVLSAFTEVGDFTISNLYSSSTTFRVYKSNQPGAFALGTTLTIS